MFFSGRPNIRGIDSPKVILIRCQIYVFQRWLAMYYKLQLLTSLSQGSGSHSFCKDSLNTKCFLLLWFFLCVISEILCSPIFLPEYHKHDTFHCCLPNVSRFQLFLYLYMQTLVCHQDSLVLGFYECPKRPHKHILGHIQILRHFWPTICPTALITSSNDI